MIQNAKPQEAACRASVIVATDRAHNPEWVDATGPAACDWLCQRGYLVVNTSVVANDSLLLAKTIEMRLLESEVLLVCGGTGLGPGDITPQTLDELSDFCIPGVGELLRIESLKFSGNSYLSRCGGYVKNGKLLLALSGNAKATIEQLTILDDLIPNALLSIQGRCKDRRKTVGN